MTFAHPHLLWLLLGLPPGLTLFFWWSLRKRESLMTQFIHARLLPGLISGVSVTRRKIRLGGLLLSVICLIVAMAGPRWGFEWEEVQQRGLDIVVAIDTSKSMLAQDIAPNRLARAKLAALDLMQQAKFDRLGLVAFAGGAFLECPLTIDNTAFRQSVEALDVNTISQGGTALADAIETALAAFKEGDNYKVLVLLTDGEDQDSGAVEAAKKAAQAGLRIFTIGIGSAEGAMVRVSDGQGHEDFIRDENGNVHKTHLNKDLLNEIASAAQGIYLPLQGAKTIDNLYESRLAPLPKSGSQEKRVRREQERYQWPLGLAIVLLIAEVFFSERGPAPKSKGAPSLRSAGLTKKRVEPAIAAAVALLGLMVLPSNLFASPGSALKDYKAKQFARAQKEYERLASVDKTGDARLLFNAGSAAYFGTNYEAAIQDFTSALSSPDVKLQQAAYFNLGNTHFRIGQAAKDLDAMQESWETAIKYFQTAVTLDKNDRDAAYNLALVKQFVEQIKQLREAVRRAKEAADDAVRRRNYHRALELMEDLLQKNPMAKPLEDYVKKLTQIDAIATPPNP
jgi:Ca-activated chloride channel family protein